MSSIHINEDGRSSYTILPCLPYPDFDRTGNFSFWGVARMFEVIRFRTMAPRLSKKKIIDWGNIGEDYTLFVFGLHYEMTKEFYRLAKDHNIDVPVKLTFQILRANRSSFDCMSEARDANNLAIVYGKIEFRYVIVNRKTRKSAILPDWIREKFSNVGIPDHEIRSKYLVPDLQGNPNYRYHLKVPHHDTDSNGHTNNGAYIRYALDGATVAALSGKLHHFREDICKYSVKSAQVIYKKECNVNDVVTVDIYESDSEQMALMFVLKKDNMAIFYATLEFYSLFQSNL